MEHVVKSGPNFAWGRKPSRQAENNTLGLVKSYVATQRCAMPGWRTAYSPHPAAVENWGELPIRNALKKLSATMRPLKTQVHSMGKVSTNCFSSSFQVFSSWALKYQSSAGTLRVFTWNFAISSNHRLHGGPTFRTPP